MAGMSHVMQDRLVRFGIAGEVLQFGETKDVVSKVLLSIWSIWPSRNEMMLAEWLSVQNV